MSRRFDGNPNGGIQLLPPQNQPQQIMVNGGPLMNDVQLVAMVAVHVRDGGAEYQIEKAIDIVARSLLRVNGGDLGRRVQELAAEAQPKLEG